MNHRYISPAIFVLCLMAMGRAMPVMSTAAEPQHMQHISELGPDSQERVVAFWNKGPRRYVRNEYYAPYYMNGMSGWREFIEKNIVPEYEWGVRRWALHNPFGNTHGGPMVFDQFILASERGFEFLVDDFVEAWADFMKTRPGTELVVYLGKMRDMDTFEQFLPFRPDLYLERALESVRPVLELREHGRVAIAFDASSAAPAEHPVNHFMRLIQSMGVPVYCEAWPPARNEHMAAFGVTAAERMYRRTGLSRGEEGYIPPEAFAGEVVILVTGNLAGNRALDRDPAKLTELIRDIIHERGFTVFAPVRVLMGRPAES